MKLLHVIRTLDGQNIGGPSYALMGILKALAASTQGTWTPLTAEDLSKVDLPVLIVVGENDNIVGSADKLQASIPGAELLTIPDKDHMMVVPDQRYKDAVLRFMKESSPA